MFLPILSDLANILMMFATLILVVLAVSNREA